MNHNKVLHIVELYANYVTLISQSDVLMLCSSHVIQCNQSVDGEQIAQLSAQWIIVFWSSNLDYFYRDYYLREKNGR